MTNKKLRPGNIHKNLFLLSLARANFETLGRLVVALVRSEGVSRPRMRELLKIYETEYVPEFERLSTDDMQNITVKRRLALIGMDFAELNVFSHAGFSPDMQTVLRENAGIFLIMLNGEAGFGCKRLRRLIAWAAGYCGDPVADAGELLDCGFDAQWLPDVDSYKHKEHRFTRAELEHIRRGGTAVAMMQGAVRCREEK